MYKLLTIGGQEYKLEYTIEASLHEECIEKLMDFFTKTIGLSAAQDIDERHMSDDEIEKMRSQVIKNGISGISNMPSVAVSVFYAGLLEHHGTGRNADKTVRSKEDAKDIIKEYFQDHAEDGTDNFYDLLMLCFEQMGEDGFFKRTGLEKLMEQGAAPQKKNRAQRRAEQKASGK